MKDKVPTPKPPAVEPMEVTRGGDIQIGALFGIVVILVVFGLIALSVLGKVQTGDNMKVLRWKIYNLAFSVFGETRHWKRLGHILW